MEQRLRGRASPAVGRRALSCVPGLPICRPSKVRDLVGADHQRRLIRRKCNRAAARAFATRRAANAVASGRFTGMRRFVDSGHGHVKGNAQAFEQSRGDTANWTPESGVTGLWGESGMVDQRLEGRGIQGCAKATPVRA